MKFIQLTDRTRNYGDKKYFINVAYITGMEAQKGGTSVHVDLAHGGLGKGDRLWVADTPEEIFQKIHNAEVL
jgi:hypothetical protein